MDGFLEASKSLNYVHRCVLLCFRIWFATVGWDVSLFLSILKSSKKHLSTTRFGGHLFSACWTFKSSCKFRPARSGTKLPGMACRGQGVIIEERQAHHSWKNRRIPSIWSKRSDVADGGKCPGYFQGSPGPRLVKYHSIWPEFICFVKHPNWFRIFILGISLLPCLSKASLKLL